MSEQIIITIIGSVQVVTVALIGVVATVLQKVRRDTSATRDNVVNDHTENMRDESDSRHRETHAWFRTISGSLSEVRQDIGGLRSDIRNLARADQGMDRRITGLEELERTQPTHKEN